MISGCVTVDSEGSGGISGRITDLFKEVISGRVVLCLRRTESICRKRPVLVCSFPLMREVSPDFGSIAEDSRPIKLFTSA